MLIELSHPASAAGVGCTHHPRATAPSRHALGVVLQQPATTRERRGTLQVVHGLGVPADVEPSDSPLVEREEVVLLDAGVGSRGRLHPGQGVLPTVGGASAPDRHGGSQRTQQRIVLDDPGDVDGGEPPVGGVGVTQFQCRRSSARR